MIIELFRAAEVAYFQRWQLLHVQDALSVDKDVVRLDVSVRDPLAMQKGQALEELVAELANNPDAFKLLGRLGLLRYLIEFLATDEIVSTQTGRHVVAHKIQVFALLTPSPKSSYDKLDIVKGRLKRLLTERLPSSIVCLGARRRSVPAMACRSTRVG